MSRIAAERRTLWAMVLAFLILLDGLGWGLALLPGLQYELLHQSLQTVRVAGIGPEIHGLSGPFEALGIGGHIVAGLLFVVVSLLKVLPAYWIWNLRRDGAVLALILLAVSVLFWYGFGLPLAPLMGIAQIIVLALAWKNLG